MEISYFPEFFRALSKESWVMQAGFWVILVVVSVAAVTSFTLLVFKLIEWYWGIRQYLMSKKSPRREESIQSNCQNPSAADD
jgi:hypothetical protein